MSNLVAAIAIAYFPESVIFTITIIQTLQRVINVFYHYILILLNKKFNINCDREQTYLLTLPVNLAVNVR